MAGCGRGLDEPPSLAVALVQLVPGLGAGVAQGRHLVEQRVVGRLAEQRHQQGDAEASGALALHAHKQNERREDGSERKRERERVSFRLSRCEIDLHFIF